MRFAHRRERLTRYSCDPTPVTLCRPVINLTDGLGFRQAFVDQSKRIAEHGYAVLTSRTSARGSGFASSEALSRRTRWRATPRRTSISWTRNQLSAGVQWASSGTRMHAFDSSRSPFPCTEHRADSVVSAVVSNCAPNGALACLYLPMSSIRGDGWIWAGEQLTIPRPMALRVRVSSRVFC